MGYESVGSVDKCMHVYAACIKMQHPKTRKPVMLFSYIYLLPGWPVYDLYSTQHLECIPDSTYVYKNYREQEQYLFVYDAFASESLKEKDRSLNSKLTDAPVQ